MSMGTHVRIIVAGGLIAVGANAIFGTPILIVMGGFLILANVAVKLFNA